MSGPVQDDWYSMCERWRSLTLEHFEPLSESKCNEILEDTLQEIKTHKLPEGMKETDSSGWQDWAQLDHDEHYVRFMTRKTLPAELKQLVDHSWSIYQDADLYKKYHNGDKCELFLQIVQQVSPDVMVLQSVEKYPDLEQLTHSLSLVFRVQTETGYLIIVRAIESPQLFNSMKAEGLSLSGNFFWDTFEVAHRNARGECDAVRYTLAGSIGSDNPTYARRMRDEILIALKRAENQFKDESIVAIESSTEEDSNPSDDQAAP